jgi:hypothetical protein
VIHFPHNIIIVTIDQLTYDNHHHNSTLDEDNPLCVPSIQVDSTLPLVNYVAPYPRCSITSEKVYLHSCFPSQDMVLVIDQVFYVLTELKLFLHLIYLTNSYFSLDFNFTICGPHALVLVSIF